VIVAPVTVSIRSFGSALRIVVALLTPVKLTALFSVKLSVYVPAIIRIVSPSEAPSIAVWIDSPGFTIISPSAAAGEAQFNKAATATAETKKAPTIESILLNIMTSL
jgi:hypothetical protein